MKCFILLLSLVMITTNAFGSGNSFTIEEPTKEINTKKSPARIKTDTKKPSNITSDESEEMVAPVNTKPAPSKNKKSLKK